MVNDSFVYGVDFDADSHLFEDEKHPFQVFTTSNQLLSRQYLCRKPRQALVAELRSYSSEVNPKVRSYSSEVNPKVGDSVNITITFSDNDDCDLIKTEVYLCTVERLYEFISPHLVAIYQIKQLA